MLEDTRQRLEVAFTAAEKNEMDVFEGLHLSFYRAALSEKINCQQIDVSKACLMVEDKRNEAVRARQERQVIEKIKDKDLKNYRREAEAREQKEVDELALYAHLRRKRQLQPITV